MFSLPSFLGLDCESELASIPIKGDWDAFANVYWGASIHMGRIQRGSIIEVNNSGIS